MEKRGLNFIFLFAFMILCLGFISSASCSITTSCSADNTVMKLASSSNTHGALYNQGSYGYYLCCDFTGTHTCDGSNNVVLRLSSATNAHAELKSETNYNYPVCFGELTCYDTSSSCNAGDMQMVSLSADTNAHIGSFSAYETKICCSPNLGFCGDGVIDSGETCDDGNTNSGDGCTSSCQVEAGWECDGNNPTCCYDRTPSMSWKLNGVSFSGGDIGVGDTLTMTIGDNLCLSSGTNVDFKIREGSNTRASPVGSVVGNSIVANYVITSSFLSILGTGSSDIYFSISDPISIQSSEISVTPAVCDLTSAYWSTTSANEGQQVQLIVEGTNCDGATINFQIKEYDTPGGTLNDPVNINPSDIVMSGNSGTGTWTAEWQSEGWPETDPPEYFFTATVSGTTESITSSLPRLEVNQAPSCGDGTCDSASENCATCSEDCGCSEPTPFCYEGGCVAECELTSAVWSTTSAIDGQQVQLIVEGTNCDGESVTFEIFEDDGIAGDDPVALNPSSVTMTSGTATGTWTAEWPDTQGEETPEYYFYARVNSFSKEIQSSKDSTYELHVESISEDCVFTSASWSDDLVEEETEVQLNIETSNCEDGETISFIVKEDDTITDDDVEIPPLDVQISGNSATGTWTAEWQDDSGLNGNGNPPEYYFIAEILSNGDDITSASPLLEVTEKIECTGIGSCANYETQSSCNADSCHVAGDSVPSGINCGAGYDCGCSWDEDSGVCEPTWGPWPNCGDGVINTGEQCDGNTWGPIMGCADFDAFTGGDLDCIGCVFDTSACTGGTSGDCGDGVINTGEQCDGNTWGPITGCENFDAFTGGNLKCNEYCLFTTSSCTGGIDPDVLKIGTCYYTEQGTDTCEDDGKLTRTLVATWIWDALNPGHLDPFNKKDECQKIEDVIVCPAQIEVPFFGTVQLIIAVALIILIYLIIRKNKPQKKK